MPSQPWLKAALLLSAVCCGPTYAQAQWQLLPQSQTKTGNPALPSWQPLTPNSPGAGSRQPSQPAAPQWQHLPTPAPGSGQAPVLWKPVAPGEQQASPPTTSQAPQRQPPTSQAEADALLKSLEPPADSYLPLIRLGQLPTAAVWSDAAFQVSGQQVSPASGGASGGTGNQNYSLRGDLQLTDTLLLSAYWTYWEDGLYKAPAS